MNSSEELAYWYHRLNGFFPLTNFVVHRHQVAQHRSDNALYRHRDES